MNLRAMGKQQLYEAIHALIEPLRDLPRMPPDMLDRVVEYNFGLKRHRASWAPPWLRRLWPRWPLQESDRAFRARVTRWPREC